MYMENNKTFEITTNNVVEYAAKIASWIKNLITINNRKGVVLGMSGGIDCSVVARLCQLADVNLHLVIMPYGNDMEKNKHMQDALELIHKFNFNYHCYDIKPAADALKTNNLSFLELASKANTELSLANLRPRIRMTYLYQIAQLGSLFVAGTGNMSERTIGYFTKWGDGACDFNPIAMLTKKEVYILAEYLEIPNSIINKKPSAGLWEGQTDEDEIGMTYPQIDNYILNGTSEDEKIDEEIAKRKTFSRHKFDSIPIFK